MKVKKETLILVAGIVWLAAGFNVARIGISVYSDYLSMFHIILSVIVFLGFGTMFYKMSKKHIERIRNYTEEKYLIFCFFA